MTTSLMIARAAELKSNGVATESAITILLSEFPELKKELPNIVYKVWYKSEEIKIVTPDDIAAFKGISRSLMPEFSCIIRYLGGTPLLDSLSDSPSFIQEKLVKNWIRIYGTEYVAAICRHVEAGFTLETAP